MSFVTLTPRFFLRSISLMAVLGGSTAISATAAYAEDEENICYASDGVTEVTCFQSNSDVAVGIPTGANTERATTTAGGNFDEVGFSLSVEEETIAGAPKPEVEERVQDRQFAAADVQVKFDGLETIPRLNVSTTDLRASFTAGAPVTFRSSTNYPSWIARAEVIIFDRTSPSKRPVARLPIASNGQAGWSMPADGSGEYEYVLRVYDAKGRYNETGALDLNRTSEAFGRHTTVDGDVIAAGEGEDRTAVANIPLYGGSVTTSGSGVAPGSTVQIMGETIPVDANGRFVAQRILPPGDHLVDVEVINNGRVTTALGREVEIPENDWFYVAIADVTIAKQIEDQLAGTIVEEDGLDVDGRLAFYLKGRVKGRTLITASADTGNGDIEDIFKRLDEKDPRQVLKRLDPEDTYLVYGDDSTSYDDTPTSGRFYVRVERDKSTALWGDFDADVSSGQLVNNNRRLYGAKLQYKSLASTPRGDSRVAATLYAAQADTRPQQDILRGTGGSAYFLSRQDINGASENIRIEIVDNDTGRVVERQDLVAGRDYSIDYIQGVVILTDPLNSTRTSGPLVTSNPLGDFRVNLVVDYEYTPGIGDVDGSSAGGSVEAWVTDDLKFKLAALSDTTDTADVDIIAATARYHFGENSWVEGEVARSDGAGLGSNFSTDGGLSYDLIASGTATDKGSAYRFETYTDFEDFGSARPGEFGFYVERREAGFATLSSTLALDETIAGFYGSYEPNERVKLKVTGETLRRSDGFRDSEATVELAYKLNERTTIEGGLSHSDVTNTGSPANSGDRTDLGLRLTYAFSEDREIYVFGQGTIAKSGGRKNNNRLGVGGSARLTEKLTASAEVSDGTSGFGAQAKLTYQATADNQVYLGYTLDPSRTVSGSSLNGRDKGVFVVGAKYRYNEYVSGFAENTFDLFGDRRSITEVYGVTYTPNSQWTYTGGFEVGTIADAGAEDFERRAISLGASYADDDRLKGNFKLEYRDEDGAGLTRDRQTWLASGGLEYKYTEEWRLLATLDALNSKSDQASFRDGRYIEVAVGAAYRPITNEKINALFKLSYINDQPGEDQTTADGTTDSPAQKSVVVSADVLFDVNEKLTFGGKYGYRKGQVAPRGTTSFTDSTAHLAILRADWHVVHKWDVLGEVRYLHTEETGTNETGALAAIYRHVGNNAKIGLGYEWGNVSDDVSNVDYDSSGLFLNLIAKF